MHREDILLRDALTTLQRLLPAGWTATLLPEEIDEHDARLQLKAPDERQAELLVEVKRRVDPRRATELAGQMTDAAGGLPVLIVSGWMSATTQAVLTDAGLNRLDLTGNVHLSLSNPGLFLRTSGAQHDPSPERNTMTLRGTKAACIVRTLAGSALPIGVRKLAASAGASPGYTSKLLHWLDRQAALSRSATGQVDAVDLRGLLTRWAQDAPLEQRSTASTWIAPRGLSDLQARLAAWEGRYAITGSLPASLHAPVAPPRRLSIYTDDPDSFAASAGLRPTDAGANVVLLVPDGTYVYEGLWRERDLSFAALPQVVADLMSGPGRGPAEAAALLDWMSQHTEVWRG